MRWRPVFEIAETPVAAGLFEGPQVWGSGIDDLITDLRGEEIDALRRLEFTSAVLVRLAARLRQELMHGRGFAVLRGLPVTESSEGIYVGLGRMLGETLPQNVKRELLYDVRDEGYNIDKQWGAVGVRFSKTTQGLQFHTDSAPALMGATPDVVGLLALRTAKQGGESAIVSAYAVHNALSREQPAYLARLYRRYHVDRRAEVRTGEPLTLQAPVFTFDGELKMRYFRFYIPKGHEVAGVPLSDEDIAPLDFVDEVCARPELQVTFAMEPGDMQFVSNNYVLHSRTAFEDWPEPERRRHLKRLWLRVA